MSSKRRTLRAFNISVNLMLITVMILASSSAFAFEPTMSILVENPPRPIIHGATNLPDGSEMIVSVTRSQNSYGAESKVVVENGQFTTEQFSQGDQDLNPGTYMIEIVMAVASVQPSSVQDIIGTNGQKMRGKLVKSGPFGPSVEYTSHFVVGKGSNNQMDATAREKAEADLKKWVISNCVYTIDLTTQMVRSGVVSGNESLGAERQRKIDECIKNVSRD